MNVLIIGSCVTRDAFTLDLLKTDFKITKYYARTTLARFGAGAVVFDESDMDIKSNFQKRMIVNDASNKLFIELQSIDFGSVDLVVIDLVDDRFGLIAYGDVFLTNSDELRSSRIFNTKEAVKLAPNEAEYSRRWEEGFVELLKYVPKEKIIINNVHWASKTDSGESISSPERIAFCESVVNRLYGIAEKHIPKNNFVDYPADIFLADGAHKWGKAPFHYVRPVYDYFIDFLRAYSRA
uniref:DUF6270 domain-containing protein n=1 Tax=Alcaligenes faecalis TaxID=511 RepID=UPI003D014DF1